MARRGARSGGSRKPFDETKHRRAAGGRFGDKPGVASAPAARRGGSVAQAHALFDKMAGKPRADVLAAAQAVGINRNTASTQFYHWQRARAQREAAALGPNPSKAERQAAAARALGVKPSTKPQPKPTPTPKPASPASTDPNRFAMRPGERPVAAFRRIADEMHDRPRAEVIATARAAGINSSTASVQYSAWARARQANPPPVTAPAPKPTAAPRTPRPMTREERQRDIDARFKREQAAAGQRLARAQEVQLAATRPPENRKVSGPATLAPEKRELLKDTTVNRPSPGSTAGRLHDKLHRAASVFPGATFHAEYKDGKIRGFSIMSDEVQITRRFNQDVVDHTFFVIEGERGNGAAKTFLAETVEAYRQSGYKSVKVHANIDVGGYAWLRYGFKPDKFSAAELDFRLQEMMDHPSYQKVLNSNQRAEVLRLAKDNRFGDIAAMTTPIKNSDGTSNPLGRDLFLGSDWHGELDLTDANAMRTFRRYAGVEK